MSNIIFKDDLAKTVTLTLTQSCNLKCSYCYEENKSPQVMSFKIAKEIIDKEMYADDNSSIINFDLFGGEPFLAYEQIKDIVTYLTAMKAPKAFRIFASTNGTLVHGEIQEWLKKYKCIFICGLSLDGNREMHNLNRDNSFDKIDLKFFANTYPLQPVKMTISKETIGNLYEGVKFCHDQGFNVNCNLAYGIDWADETNIAILERELNKLIVYYLHHPDIKPCSMLEMDIKMAGIPQAKTTVRKWCGAGTHMHTYDIDGNMYPCQFFMPLSAGNEKAEAAKKLRFQEEVPDSLLDEKCRNCVIKTICPSCYGANFINSGSLYHKDDNMCKLTKIIMLARSLFKAEQLNQGQLKLHENEEQALIRSIINIQENLVI